MQAQKIMTNDVVTVLPDTRVAQVARPPLEHKFSAAPVVDRSGMGVGMVSEGDLIGRSDGDRQRPGDWWLSLRAEGEAFHPDFLATTARHHVMHTSRGRAYQSSSCGLGSVSRWSSGAIGNPWSLGSRWP